MRRRSCTLFAESMEEYTMLAKQNISCNVPEVRRNSKNLKNLQQFALAKVAPSMEIEEDYSQPSNSSNIWDDFDYKAKPFDFKDGESTSASETSEPFRSSDTDDDALDFSLYSENNRERVFVTKRFMALSSENSKSHSLINSVFRSNDENNVTPFKQALDLMIKTEEEHGLKCQFWMKSIENNKFNNLMKAYYQSTSTFIFVYSVSDRESFRLVEEAIKDVLSQIPKEKFAGVLLGNKINYEETREVSYGEGIELQRKYGLMLFDETYEEDEKLKENIINPLSAHL